MKSLATMVTGAGGPAGRAVSHYFQQNGIAVVYADMNLINGPNLRRLPPAVDGGFLNALDQILDEAEIGLLVPTVTEELPKIADHRDSIRQRECAVFVSPAGSVRIANDKWETVQALSDFGIAVPSSYSGTSRQELLDKVSFPMLSKPRCSRGGRGILLHQSDADLPHSICADRIFQEFLPGVEYDVNLFAQPGGGTVTCVVLEKTALKQRLYGNALSTQRVIEPAISGLAEAAVQALCLEGPLDIDIRRGTDGRPFILEINARVGANVRIAEEVLIAMLNNWRNQ
jgi:carbamoylphosphate synthase large subunit